MASQLAAKLFHKAGLPKMGVVAGVIALLAFTAGCVPPPPPPPPPPVLQAAPPPPPPPRAVRPGAPVRAGGELG